MSLGFTLIADENVWVSTSSGSYNAQRKWVQTYNDPVDTKCSYGPYKGGEDTIVLPSGVHTTDAYMLYTQSVFKTASDLTGSSTTADLIYLEDPAVSPNTPAYVVWTQAKYRANTGFVLLKGHNEYVCIRRDKLEV